MAVIRGFTRFRKHQFGKQSAFGSFAATSRAIPWRGVPEINPNWSDIEDVDVGSIDPVLDPYRTQMDITVPFTGPMGYQDLPLMGAAGIIGGVSPTGGGAAKTWQFNGLSLTPTTLDYFTDEFADDVSEDGFKIRDLILESWELSFDESLGPWQFAGAGRGGYVDTHVTPGTNQVGSNFPLIMGADTRLFIDDTSGGIGGTQISDALHSMTIRHEFTVDQKRFANGSNTRFALAGYGIAGRVVTAEFTFAKTAAIVAALNSETVDWLNADPVTRYIKVDATSPSIITGSTPYSAAIYLAGTWRTRSDGEVGGNAVVTLSLTGRYSSALGYPIRLEAVNSLATLP